MVYNTVYCVISKYGSDFLFFSKILCNFFLEPERYGGINHSATQLSRLDRLAYANHLNMLFPKARQSTLKKKTSNIRHDKLSLSYILTVLGPWQCLHSEVNPQGPHNGVFNSTLI